jgi:O-antigen/teichoic acid export membrane protein
MGIIQKQSIQSTIVILMGFALGAFNMLILAPKVLTVTQLGLTRIITDAGITFAMMCTFGSLPIVYKFYPFYKSILKPRQNDLPFLTFCVCMFGFLLFCIVGFFAKDIIVRKFSERSPLFVEYSYLVYPFAFFYLCFVWCESFSWSFKKGVTSNFVKETLPRLIFTALLLLFAIKLLSLGNFFLIFSFSYLLPSIIIILILRKTGNFRIVPVLSSVTKRMGGKMVNYGLFLFGAQFLNLLSRTADTFILTAKSSGGLKDAAVFTIATYIITLMEVPQRSINSISIPIISESWKAKDLKKINNIYTKSVTNLLVIGLVMLALILLNVQNLGIYLGRDFRGFETVVVIMGIAKLIDLGTGVNGQIIGTSNYWKVDFATNVIYTVLALPLNYILISRFGLTGAAYSFLISLSFYNVMRFGFLWYKFGLQPYTIKDLLVICIAVIAAVLCYLLPAYPNIFIDSIIRSILFLVLFLPLLYFSKISAEINEIINKYFQMVVRGKRS